MTTDTVTMTREMYQGVIESSRSFGRQDAERQAMEWLAAIVESAGGSIEVPRRLVMDPPELVMIDSPLKGTYTFETRRRTSPIAKADTPR